MTEQRIVAIDGELFHAHSEFDVEAVGKVVVRRGGGRPRKENPPTEKSSKGDLDRSRNLKKRDHP